MKVAIYSGSFNPFHEGHLDVIKQALKLFDKVVIAKGLNPEKPSVVSPLTFSSPSVMMELKALNENEDLKHMIKIKEEKAEIEMEKKELEMQRESEETT